MVLPAWLGLEGVGGSLGVHGMEVLGQLLFLFLNNFSLLASEFYHYEGIFMGVALEKYVLFRYKIRYCDCCD